MFVRLTIACAFLAVAMESAVTLDVSASSVDAGVPVILTWQSPVDAAFISGFGRVEGTGSIEVTPLVSTDYTLVVPEGETFRVASVHVKVQGAKGGLGFPDLADFREVQASGEIASTGFADFAGHVYKSLEKTGFGVRGDMLPNRPYWFLYTNFRAQPKLVRPSDRGIRAREVAYGIRISNGVTGRIFYEIIPLVRYQRLAEARRRDETDPQVIQLAVQQARNLVEAP